MERELIFLEKIRIRGCLKFLSFKGGGVWPKGYRPNFRKVQWLLFGKYHQPSQKDSYYFNNLDKALDLYSHYDKKLSVGDFNTEVSDNVFSTIPYQHDLENLAKR